MLTQQHIGAVDLAAILLKEVEEEALTNLAEEEVDGHTKLITTRKRLKMGPHKKNIAKAMATWKRLITQIAENAFCPHNPHFLTSPHTPLYLSMSGYVH